MGPPGFHSFAPLCSALWLLPFPPDLQKEVGGYSNEACPPLSREGGLCGALLNWMTCPWRAALVTVPTPRRVLCSGVSPPAGSHCLLLKTSVRARSLSFLPHPPPEGPLEFSAHNRCSMFLGLHTSGRCGICTWGHAWAGFRKDLRKRRLSSLR